MQGPQNITPASLADSGRSVSGSRGGTNPSTEVTKSKPKVKPAPTRRETLGVHAATQQGGGGDLDGGTSFTIGTAAPFGLDSGTAFQADTESAEANARGAAIEIANSLLAGLQATADKPGIHVQTDTLSMTIWTAPSSQALDCEHIGKRIFDDLESIVAASKMANDVDAQRAPTDDSDSRLEMVAKMASQIAADFEKLCNSLDSEKYINTTEAEEEDLIDLLQLQRDSTSALILHQKGEQQNIEERRTRRTPYSGFFISDGNTTYSLNGTMKQVNKLKDGAFSSIGLNKSAKRKLNRVEQFDGMIKTWAAAVESRRTEQAQETEQSSLHPELAFRWAFETPKTGASIGRSETQSVNNTFVLGADGGMTPNWLRWDESRMRRALQRIAERVDLMAAGDADQPDQMQPEVELSKDETGGEPCGGSLGDQMDTDPNFPREWEYDAFGASPDSPGLPKPLW
ncbi:hypothetical protein DB88DRAFT_470023 [Papiliotrema laurentii]|uniref:Uncharacterized protein n=1 Tax=Papiliotrema laurentii TaxID=5418 RepID=A0AAD9FW67_PAPLA|nr:hypothetical protein DB88DRAFT_470023 [Papiliotrema laurentii]